MDLAATIAGVPRPPKRRLGQIEGKPQLEAEKLRSTRLGVKRYAKNYPFLWFNDTAEEAMNFYASIFNNSKIGSITRYGDAGPGPKGKVMTTTFQLDGQQFMGLNGGPHFTFSQPYRSL